MAKAVENKPMSEKQCKLGKLTFNKQQFYELMKILLGQKKDKTELEKLKIIQEGLKQNGET